MASTDAKAGPDAGPAFRPSAEVPDDAALWLVRHGETQWSRAGRHTGRTDLELTRFGRAQADALRGMLADVRPALVLCSPLGRARDTAERAGLGTVTIEPDLAEWDYGDYEGRTSHEIRADRPGWTLFRDGVPHGETIEQVSARADRVLERAADALRRGPVVLVAHGHINRVLAVRWLELAPSTGENLELGPAAPCLLSRQHGVPVIAHWNLPNPAKPEGTDS
jgi:probable phosphoglycerate mutase